MIGANLQKAERIERLKALSIMFLIILPLLTAALRVPFRLSHFAPRGDIAILEMYTLHTSTGSQLLGPYSRFHWNHPGPLHFYLLLPLYLITGRESWSLVLSNILINIGSMVLILKIASRRGGQVMFRWTAIVLAFHFLFLGKRFLSPWNPDITMLPLAALFLLAGAACIGSFRSLLLGLFIGSFIVQTHIAYLPLVTVLLGLASICNIAWIVRSKSSQKLKTLFIRFAVAALFTLVLWMPAIWEQMRQDPGNISRIYEFFSQRGGKHTFGEIFLAVTSMMVPPFEIRTAFFFGVFVPVAQILLTAIVLVESIRENRRFSAALCMLGLAANLVTLWSARQIVGNIRSYLLFSVSMVALVNWIPIGVFVWQKLFRRGYYSRFSTANGFAPANFLKKAGYFLIILSLTGVNSWAMFETNLVRHDDRRLQPLFQDLRDYLEANGVKKPLLLIATHGQWETAAGVILQLYKAKRPFAIQGWDMFGSRFQPSGDEDVYIWFTGIDLHHELTARPVNHLIARERNFFIYQVPLSWLRKPGIHKPPDLRKRSKPQ